MKLSTRMRYGLRALAELAQVQLGETMTVRDIAERQKLSAKYLESIMTTLKAAGIVRAVRGLNGGYALAHAPQEITLSEVFAALEGSTAPVECVESPRSCPMEPRCPSRQTWVEIRDAIDSVLGRTTLADMARRSCDKRGAAVPMYDI